MVRPGIIISFQQVLLIMSDLLPHRRHIDYINGSCNMWEFPLTLRYDFAKNDKTKIFRKCWSFVLFHYEADLYLFLS